MKRRSGRSGEVAIEYGLICALMVVGIIAGISSLGDSIESFFTAVGNGFTPPPP